MKKIFSIDRLEGRLAVCIADDGECIITPIDSLAGMKARDVFSAETDGETLSDIIPLPDERDKRLREGHEMLQRLLNKNKNN